MLYSEKQNKEGIVLSSHLTVLTLSQRSHCPSSSLFYGKTTHAWRGSVYTHVDGEMHVSRFLTSTIVVSTQLCTV